MDNEALKQWKDKFQAEHGRMPTMAEFQAAKKSDVAAAEKVTPAAPTPAPVQPVQTPKQPMTKKRKALLAAGGVGVVVLGCAYAYGNHYFSKESVAERSAKILVEQKPKQYADLLVWDDTKKTLSEDEVKPVVSYMADQGLTDKGKIAKKLETSGLEVATLKETGKNLLIFPKYQVVVEPITVNIESNQSDLTLKVNGVDEGKVNESKKLDHLAPGIYKFEANAKIDKVDVPVKESKTILHNTTIPLNIQLISFSVESNMKDGDLYIGDTKVGTLTDGKYKVKNEPITDSVDVYVTQKFKDSTVKSEKVNLNTMHDQTTVTLNAEGMIDDSRVRDVWQSVTSAINAYASNERVPSDLEMFKGGAENKAFDDFKNNIAHNLNNAKRVAERVSYTFEDVKSVKQISETEAEYVVEVEAEFYYASDTDKKDRSSGYKTQVFELTGTLYFDESTDKWVLDTVSDDQKLIKDEDNVS